MRTYRNHKRIKRNHNIGRVLVFGGLAVLGAGFLYSRNNLDDFNTVLLAAIVGTILSQYGLAILRLWGRSPRNDELIDAALKGLDNQWSLFHYIGPVHHMLFGPAGSLALLPQDEEGQIRYADSGWIQDRPASGFLRRGGERQLGKLPRSAEQAVNDFTGFQRKAWDGAGYAAQPVLLFLSDQAQVQADPAHTPIPAVHHKKAKDWLRRRAKARAPDPSQLAQLASQHGVTAEDDQDKG